MFIFQKLQREYQSLISNDIVYHKNDEIGELYFKVDEMADRLENVIKLYRDEAEKNIIKKEELEEE